MYKSISAILLIAFLGGCAKTPEQKIMQEMETATQHLERFEFEEAQQAFDKAAEYSQGIPYDRYGKALIFEQQLYYYDALNEFLEITIQDPEFAPAYAGVYRIFSRLDHSERALSIAARYFELDPGNADAAMARVHSLFSANQLVAAEGAALKAQSQGLDETTVQLIRSRVFFELHDFDSAQALLDRAMENPLNSTRLQFEAAEVLQSAGLIDSAMALSRRAVGSPSATVSALYAHFYRALENNYYADARHVIAQLKQKGAAEGVQLTLKLLIARDQESFTISRVRASDLMEVTPRNVSTIMLDITSATGQFTDARMIQILRGVMQNYMNELNYNLELRDFIDLQIDLQRVETDDRVFAWEELKKIQGPLANLKKVQLARAYLTYRVGKFDDALDRLIELRNAHIHYPDWLTGIADIYAHPSIRKHELAEETYQSALERDKWYRLALINQVEMLRRLKRYDEALKLFDDYRHLEERFSDIALLKGVCLAENNNFESALAIYENRGSNVRGNLDHFVSLLRVLERKYRTEEVVNLADICANWAGDNVDILTFAARLLSNHGLFERAQELSQRALTIEASSLAAQVQEARSAYGLGSRDLAFASFERVLEEEPNHGDANYYFSRILAGENLDPQRASNLARSAILVFYDDIKASMNLCEVYYLFGQYNFAYGEANKASRRFPDSPLIWYNLGRTSQKLERDSTKVYLLRAIELELGGKDLENAKEILADLRN